MIFPLNLLDPPVCLSQEWHHYLPTAWNVSLSISLSLTAPHLIQQLSLHFYFRMHHTLHRSPLHTSPGNFHFCVPNHCNSLFSSLSSFCFSLNYEQYMYSLPGLMCCMIWLLHILCHSLCLLHARHIAFPQYLRHIKNFPAPQPLYLFSFGNLAFSMGPFFHPSCQPKSWLPNIIFKAEISTGSCPVLFIVFE